MFTNSVTCYLSMAHSIKTFFFLPLIILLINILSDMVQPRFPQTYNHQHGGTKIWTFWSVMEILLNQFFISCLLPHYDAQWNISTTIIGWNAIKFARDILTFLLRIQLSWAEADKVQLIENENGAKLDTEELCEVSKKFPLVAPSSQNIYFLAPLVLNIKIKIFIHITILFP